MGISVGIDLGTSNSVVAIMREGGPEVLADAGGRSLQPSVVALGHGGQPVVGQIARQQLTYAPDTTIASAKRLIGRRYEDPETQRIRASVGWGIFEGEAGDARIRVQGKTSTAQEISAHILVHMVKIAEAATGETVDSAVITVPAYFNDAQRQATRDAAEIASLKCLRIINEPTAAAMAYGYDRNESQRVVVYDLGGGTFDVSVLRIGNDVIEVLATAGDTFLGGDDFDQVIADHIRTAFDTEGLGSIPSTHQTNVRLKIAAEKLKQQLSVEDSASTRIAGLARSASGVPVDVEAGLNRALARRLCMSLIQRSFVVCDDALAQAGVTPAQVDGIVLVGGMTRFPIIKDAVAQYFGEDPIDHINPDEVVACGAAIQAAQLTDVTDTPAPVLLDVTPQTLGVRTVGDMMDAIIPRNSAIPSTASKVFHTVRDNQTEVRIRVYQGDAREARSNYLLGEFVLDGLDAGPRGHAKVKVTFSIDADGMVDVVATASGTGSSKEMRVESSSNLSRDEVSDMRASHAASVSVDVEAAEGKEVMGIGIDIDDEDDLDKEDLMTAEIEIDDEDWNDEVSSDDDLFLTADDVTG
jgi:molecular chaperone DnaK